MHTLKLNLVLLIAMSLPSYASDLSKNILWIKDCNERLSNRLKKIKVDIQNTEANIQIIKASIRKTKANIQSITTEIDIINNKEKNKKPDTRTRCRPNITRYLCNFTANKNKVKPQEINPESSITEREEIEKFNIVDNQLTIRNTQLINEQNNEIEKLNILHSQLSMLNDRLINGQMYLSHTNELLWKNTQKLEQLTKA